MVIYSIPEIVSTIKASYKEISQKNINDNSSLFGKIDTKIVFHIEFCTNIVKDNGLLPINKYSLFYIENLSMLISILKELELLKSTTENDLKEIMRLKYIKNGELETNFLIKVTYV